MTDISWFPVGPSHLATLAPVDLPEQYEPQLLDVSGHRVMAVPHRPEIASALRLLGHDAPSPAAGYKYPGRFPPMDHQVKTVQFCVDWMRLANLSDPGTGKTLSSIWAADCLMRQGRVRRVLVVAPKSTLNHVWRRELFDTLPTTPVVSLSGTREKKQKVAQDLRIKWLIVNYESLHLLEGYLPEVDLVIVDEATRVKNYKARATKALVRIAENKRLWLLTGTPAPQAPTDAYSAIRMLRSGNYKSFKWFRDLTMLQITSFTWKPRDGAADVVASQYQPAIRFRRQDCFDLPDRQIIDMQIDLSPQQDKLAKDFLKQAWAELGGKKITAVNAGVSLSKALQVMAGGVYHPVEKDSDDVQTATAVDASPMLEQIRALVEQSEGPTLVFAPYRISVAVIAQHLENAGLKIGRVTGATPQAERDRIFDQVQAGTLDGVVAVPTTMSHGLTLTTATTEVWVTPPFSFETYEQGIARIYRKGQKRKTVIFRLTYTSLTNMLWKRIDGRASLQDTILRLMEESK